MKKQPSKTSFLRQQKMLKSIRTLVADNDRQMAGVLLNTLGVMGFGDVTLVKDGSEVVDALKDNAYDLLITEWPMEPMDGIELVRALRRDERLRIRRMPIIMLTGKAEKADVEAARDSGITEFVIKPYTSQTLFDRLERLVEHPLPFVLTPEYVGPDRRRRKEPVKGKDRRKTKPRPLNTLTEPPEKADQTPRILAPEPTLKRKILLGDKLSSIITPEVIEQAQVAINAFRDESLVWLRQDLEKIEKAYRRMLKREPVALKEFRDGALAIKSRAGTFGYHGMSETARLLYRFACSEYQENMAESDIILLTHIEALKIILSESITGKSTDTGYQMLLSELVQLVARYRAIG